MGCSKPGRCSSHGTGDGSPVWAWIRLVGLLGWLFSAGIAAETDDLVVIVNPQSGVEQLTRAEVINIFLGRQKKLPSGKAALTVDLNGANAEKQQFYEQLVGKELAEINSYWARLIFSGQGSPPRQAQATDEVLDIVENNLGAIGYVTSAQVTPRVKVVYTLGH